MNWFNMWVIPRYPVMIVTGTFGVEIGTKSGISSSPGSMTQSKVGVVI